MKDGNMPPATAPPPMDSAYPPPYPRAVMAGNYPAQQPYAPTPETILPGVPQHYPPGGPQMYPPGAPQTTVILPPPVQTTILMGAQLRDSPAVTICPSCNQAITTRVAYSVGTMTWLISGSVILLGCWLGCCFIPFCIEACKDVDHFCPNCNHHIYKYKRLS